MVIGDGARLILAGIVIGSGGSLALIRLMAGLLYGVGATDPVTFVAVALLLTAVSLLAGLLPARRTAKVNPIIALRSE